MLYDEDWYAGTASKGPLKSFEIVTNDAVILRGTRDEAIDQELKGKVLLDLKSSISGKVRLRFTRRIRHTERIAQSADPFGPAGSVDLVFHEVDIYDEYLVAENKKFAPGQYSWDFNIPIKADTAASLEGPPTTYVVYRLKCIIERGVLSKDLVQKKHVRIHRTLKPDSLALQQAMITDSHWENKCSYVIQTPTKGIIYGTHVPMEYKVAPLGKGIRPMKVKCTITQVIRFHRSIYTRVPFRTRDVEREICENILEVPDTLEQDVESFYTVQQKVALPHDLTKCCQTYKEPLVPDIELRHYVNYKVAISNPDGHVSEIQGRLPIHLFFLQDMRVDGTSVAGVPDGSAADPMAAALDDVPPDYAHSCFDRLYNDVPMSGFATPAVQSGALTPSGVTTPRNHSFSALDMLAEGDDDEDGNTDEQTSANTQHNVNDEFIRHGNGEETRDHEPDANALRTRLERIKLSRRSSSRYGDSGAGSGGRSGAHSPVSIIRNRSFQSANLAHSPLANTSMTPPYDHDDLIADRSQPTRGPSSGPTFAIDRPGAGHSTSHSASPDGSQSATPAISHSAHPTRPSSPVHFEDLSRVPSYHTAMITPAPSGTLGSQHGGAGLPTYHEVEEESASRGGSITGSTAASGSVTPATAPSLGLNSGGIGSSSPGDRQRETRPGGGLEGHGRSRSGIFGSLLHKNK